MSPASPIRQRTTNEAEAPPTSEPSRPTERQSRPAPAGEALNEEDFDFHDTIPAPPWLGDADSDEEPSLPLP